jgi:hypothetical protein
VLWRTSPPFPPHPSNQTLHIITGNLPCPTIQRCIFFVHTSYSLFHLSTNSSSNNTTGDIHYFSVSSVIYFCLVIYTIYQNFPHNGKFVPLLCRPFPFSSLFLFQCFPPSLLTYCAQNSAEKALLSKQLITKKSVSP